MKNFLGKLWGGTQHNSTLTLERPMNLSRAIDSVRDVVSPKTTQEIIDEIHHAFNTAGDKLLAEAQSIIAATHEDSFAKADRLRRIGFTATKEVEDSASKKAALDASKTMQQLLVDYAVRYPTYRFINEEGIEAICEKYNLVFGKISDYKGFVPDKNLREIEAFPGVKEQDAVYQRRLVFRPGKYSDWTNDWESTPEGRQVMARRMQEDGYREHMMHNARWESNYERRNSKDLQICAPVKDMNMEGKQLDGHRIIMKHIPDPVVLAPVKGNLFIILTAWGDEASDPLVLKENIN